MGKGVFDDHESPRFKLTWIGDTAPSQVNHGLSENGTDGSGVLFRSEPMFDLGPRPVKSLP